MGRYAEQSRGVPGPGWRNVKPRGGSGLFRLEAEWTLEPRKRWQVKERRFKSHDEFARMATRGLGTGGDQRMET